MESIKILIVEDSPATRDYLSELVQIIGYRAHAVDEKTEFMATLHAYNPDLLLLGSSNHVGHLRAFADVLEREKRGTPILFVRDGSVTLEGEKIPETANISCLPRDFDSADLKLAIEKIVEKPHEPDYKELDNTIVGQTPTMVQIKKHIARLSKSDVTVLISGESGTGKELVARAIHKLSPRADMPFIKVNSAALPTNLLESELFGFEKGAFTGAYQKKLGRFELAHSGTILLDEISEIPSPMQAKLLQVLQDNEFSSLGSTTDTKIDTRVLAATNANLGEMVSEGRFRSDLYFRLNVVSIHVPPLRERKEDLGLLCQHFLKKYATLYGRDPALVNERIREQLSQHSWPGNVRELQNFIQGITVLGHKESFYENIGSNGHAGVSLNGQGALPAARPGSTAVSGAVTRRSLKEVCKEATRKAETKAILNALFHTHWNRRRAADLLKVSYKAVLNKIKEYGIEAQYRELPRKDNGSIDYGPSPPG
jgi:two-component system response regulator AtoC